MTELKSPNGATIMACDESLQLLLDAGFTRVEAKRSEPEDKPRAKAGRARAKKE